MSDEGLDDAGRNGAVWEPLAVAAAIVLAAWIGLVATWGEAPYTLTFDDAYYFFEIGQNLADGHGFTFDRINETNGFMPLWQLLCVPVFALGFEGDDAARVLLVLQLVFWLGAAVLLARTIHAAVPGLPGLAAAGREGAAARVVALASAGFAAMVGSPYVLRTLANGLESGVTDLLYAALLLVAVRVRGDFVSETGRGLRLRTSALLALLFLGRTDVVVLLGVLGLASILALRRSGAASPVRRLLELFGLPALTVVTYTAWNHVAFGVPVQISGVVKRVPIGGRELVGMLVFAALAALAAVRSDRRRRALVGGSAGVVRFPRLTTIWASTGWFAAFLVLVIGYYTLLSAQQWLWYFAPHVVYVVLLGGALLLDFAEAAVAEAPKRHSPTRAVLPIAALFVLPLFVSLPVQWRSFAEPDQRSIQLANRDAGIWISQNLPPDAVLGSWDAGVVGYFADQSIVNLDGVVNSLEWHEAQQDGTTGAFLERAGVDYLVNHAALVDGEEPGVEDKVRALFGDPAATVEQVHRVEFVYSGRFEGSPDTGGPKHLAVFVYRVVRSSNSG